MNRIVAGTTMLALLLLPLAAGAQTAAAPVEKPDYSKYFYFHKEGVSLTAAQADFDECTTYGANVTNIEPGAQVMYVPYTSALSPLANGLAGGIGGALGGLLADALFKGPQRRAMRRTVMRKCMGFKGYQRYGLDKEAWEKLADGDDRAAISARFAALAAGPRPTAVVLAS